MSNLSGASIVNSNVVSGSRHVTGIPRKCWCGYTTAVNTSKSARNPGRRFYRCSYASAAKLAEDEHIFKWVDEAMLDEINQMSNSIARLEEQLRALDDTSLEQQKNKIKMMLRESEWRMKKSLFLIGIGFGVLMTTIGWVF